MVTGEGSRCVNLARPTASATHGNCDTAFRQADTSVLALAEPWRLRGVAFAVLEAVAAGPIPKQVGGVVGGLVVQDGHVGGALHGDSPAGTQAGDNVVLDLVSANQRPGVAPIEGAISPVIVGVVARDNIAVASAGDEDPKGITESSLLRIVLLEDPRRSSTPQASVRARAISACS